VKKRRGTICLSLEALRCLLHLREGITVTGAAYSAEAETVEFYLTGESLRLTGRREHPERFPLTGLMEDFE
jgi:hypothetical protein